MADTTAAVEGKFTSEIVFIYLEFNCSLTLSIWYSWNSCCQLNSLTASSYVIT